jgi:hypothetical protein
MVRQEIADGLAVQLDKSERYVGGAAEREDGGGLGQDLAAGAGGDAGIFWACVRLD